MHLAQHPLFPKELFEIQKIASTVPRGNCEKCSKMVVLSFFNALSSIQRATVVFPEIMCGHNILSLAAQLNNCFSMGTFGNVSVTDFATPLLPCEDNLEDVAEVNTGGNES